VQTLEPRREVRDTFGNAAAQRALGSFIVRI
jgi:hypothetical protein